MENEPLKTQRAGRKMFFLAGWVCVFTVLYFFFDEHLQERYNPNRNPQTQTTGDKSIVVLERNPQGHYLVTGQINALPITFLLDTGATNVSVPLAIADKVGLVKGPRSRVQTASGVAIVYQTIIDEISVGGIRLYNIRANINPHFDSREVLLGMSFLKNLDFTQEGNELTLRQR
ncbi:MAG: retropepsin-like aspartic protease family protein [Candidatus Oxydemutatoraceae bacterium WSBS_2016_MAG_OTU14]